MRNLLLFIVALIGVWWIRRALRKPRDEAPGSQPGAAGPQAPERMLACNHCGLHVPQSEGVTVGERFYCCEEHRRAHGD